MSVPAALPRPWLVVGALLIAAALVASVVAPLATYSVTLACFGLPHVVSELRYVDARFSARLTRRVLIALAALLGLVVAVRLLALTGVWKSPPRVELLLIAGLAAVPLAIPGTSTAWRVACVGAVAGLGAGIAWAPAATFVCLAAAHNLTPLGFVAERLEGRRRRQALAVGALLFLGLPAAIASGVLQRALGSWPDLAPFAFDGLRSQLGVFLPTGLHGSTWAPALFSAVVLTQCLHYLYVLGYLPALDREAAWWGDGEARRSLVPWPGPRAFALGLAGVVALSIGVFLLLSFGRARSLYGVAAAVHAWVEVPLLLAAPALLARNQGVGVTATA